MKVARAPLLPILLHTKALLLNFCTSVKFIVMGIKELMHALVNVVFETWTCAGSFCSILSGDKSDLWLIKSKEWEKYSCFVRKNYQEIVYKTKNINYFVAFKVIFIICNMYVTVFCSPSVIHFCFPSMYFLCPWSTENRFRVNLSCRVNKNSHNTTSGECGSWAIVFVFGFKLGHN